MTEPKRTLLLVTPEDFHARKYLNHKDLLTDEGFSVSVVSDDLSNIDHSDYDAMFSFGGKEMVEFSDNKLAQRLLRKFMLAKKPVGLAGYASLLAAKAKAAAGRLITGHQDIRDKVEKFGAKWVNVPIEKDGCLFTSDDFDNLVFVIASLLKGGEVDFESPLDPKAVSKKLSHIYKIAARIDDGADYKELMVDLESLIAEEGK
jgi:hypothetical protein